MFFVLYQRQTGSCDCRRHFIYYILKKCFIDRVNLAFPIIASNVFGLGNRNHLGANNDLFH